MTIYDILAFWTITIWIIRIYLIYKLDRLRDGENNMLLKLIFGAYVFYSFFPSLQKTNNTKEWNIKRLSNILFVTFWALFATLMFVIWINHR